MKRSVERVKFILFNVFLPDKHLGTAACPVSSRYRRVACKPTSAAFYLIVSLVSSRQHSRL